MHSKKGSIMFSVVRYEYWYIFKHFLSRDWLVYRHDAMRYFINYGIIYASLFSLSFGLIIPTMGFGYADPYICTSIICGQIIWVIFPISYHASTRILLDLQHIRFITYQLTIVPASLIWLEKIIFHTAIIFINVFPFFITTKLILGPSLLFGITRFPLLLVILLICSFFFSIFSLTAVSYIPSTLYTTTFWVRFVYPLIGLSGLLVSWHQIHDAYPRLAMLIRLNPFLYVTEALRNVLLPSGAFIPIGQCVVILVSYSIILSFIMFFFFRKKLDYV